MQAIFIIAKPAIAKIQKYFTLTIIVKIHNEFKLSYFRMNNFISDRFSDDTHMLLYSLSGFGPRGLQDCRILPRP